jgi:Domain of unknown function DUF11/Putative peptidoglycan binding domain
MSIQASRMLAAFLAVALIVGPVSPLVARADVATSTPATDTATTTPSTVDERLAARAAVVFPDIVVGEPEATTTPTTIEATTTAATSTASTGTTTPDVPATSTPPDTATSTQATSTPATDEAATMPRTVSDPSTFSSATTSSAVLDPSQSDTDNTDFNNITNGALPPGANDPRPRVDASATSTDALTTDPLFTVATSTNGTGSKIGGTIFTGAAVASTSVKNILNITKSNVDGLGVTNGSIITADTDNTGDVTTHDDTRAFTGDNRGEGGEGDATIRTGKAVSSAQVINVVNTNLFNSRGLVLFLNPLNGDGFDLRTIDLSYFWNGGAVGASPTQYGCTILTCLNSSALSILNKNVANVDNNVYVRAATGGNAATSTGSGGVDITTGNAYASANVLNLVNTNFINSKYLLLSFDNFGDLNDDIVLPDTSFFSRLLESGASLPELNSSSYVVNNTNDENFTGTTTAQAITGGNVATSTGLGHGEILTGKAYTSSTNYTAANQTRVGGASVSLQFHISGRWSGTVKGLPAGMTWRRTEYGVEIMSVGAAGAARGPLGEYNSSAFVASSTNKATVNTDVNVLAETGNNSAQTEHATSTMRTGDAYAAANVINMVNTNIINRNWVFASFNIFGDWSGDIAFGGHSPDLGVDTVVETPGPLRPDSEVTYRFTVANTGDVVADNIALSTAYDTSLLRFTRGNTPSANTATGTSWNLGTLAAGETRDISMTARVLVRDLPAGFSVSIPLTATVASSERDQNDANNTEQTFITISAPGSPPSGGGDGDGRDRGGTTGGTTGGGSGTTGGGTTDGGSGNTGGGNPSGGSSAPPTDTGQTGTTQPNLPPLAVVPTGTTNGGGAGADSPSIRITKTANVATTSAPATVNYKVVVTNSKDAGSAYSGLLTDTLYNPHGTIMSSRSWDLETIVSGDQITLTYDVEFASTTIPGAYKNIARVMGKRGSPFSESVKLAEVSRIVHVLSNGSVLGLATSTIKIATSTISSAPASCIPLLTSYMSLGKENTKADVLKLQAFLNSNGSRLPVTGFYGPMTAAAVRAFQQKYASEILVPLGLTRPTGNVYGSTQRKINALACGIVSPTLVSSAKPVGVAVTKSVAPKIIPKKPVKKAVAKPAPETKKSTNKWLGTLFPSLSL